MLDSIPLKRVIALSASSTSLCLERAVRKGEKKRVRKEAVAAQAPASVTSMKAKRQRNDSGRHCVLSASHSSLIHYGWETLFSSLTSFINTLTL